MGKTNKMKHFSYNSLGVAVPLFAHLQIRVLQSTICIDISYIVLISV